MVRALLLDQHAIVAHDQGDEGEVDGDGGAVRGGDAALEEEAAHKAHLRGKEEER